MKLENSLSNLRKNKHSFFNIDEGYINSDLLKNDLLIFNEGLFPIKDFFKKTNRIFNSFGCNYRKVIYRKEHFNIYFFINEIILRDCDSSY